MVKFAKTEACYICKEQVTEGAIRDSADPRNPRVRLCTKCDAIMEKMIADGKKSLE